MHELSFLLDDRWHYTGRLIDGARDA